MIEQFIEEIKKNIDKLSNDETALKDLNDRFPETWAYVNLRRFHTLEDVFWYLQGVLDTKQRGTKY